MAKTSNEDINLLIGHYQQTNKLLRTRAIILSILFLLVLGLQNNLKKSEEKRIGLIKTIFTLNEIVEADNLKHAFDSLKFGITWEYFAVKYNMISDEQINKLEYDLSKSNFTDKTPLYELIGEYDKQIRELGLSPEDYSINILGTNTSFSDWVYFAPIILLLLYHDMTLMYLYRKSLRNKLIVAGVERWQLGSEIFGTEYEQEETPAHRFIRFITTAFIIVLLFLPLIPAFTSSILYVSNTSDADTRPLLIFVQWISPVVMTIELLMIYHSENFLGVRTFSLWIGKWLSKVPSRRTIIINSYLSIFISVSFSSIGYYFKEQPSFDFGLTLTVLLTVSILPLASILLHRFPDNRTFKGLRLIGRIILIFWVLNLILFTITVTYPAYPAEFWTAGGWITFMSATLIAAIYVWVYSGKKAVPISPQDSNASINKN